MNIRDFYKEYEVVGNYGLVSKFRKEHNHIMKGLVGKGYTIAVNHLDELSYKFSTIKNEQIEEVIISPFAEKGKITILKKGEGR